MNIDRDSKIFLKIFAIRIKLLIKATIFIWISIHDTLRNRICIWEILLLLNFISHSFFITYYIRLMMQCVYQMIYDQTTNLGRKNSFCYCSEKRYFANGFCRDWCISNGFYYHNDTIVFLCFVTRVVLSCNYTFMIWESNTIIMYHFVQ